MLLNMTRSFYGREEVGLAERLLEELPGILAWAVDGWRRLRARWRCVMPEASRDMLDGFTELSSPMVDRIGDLDAEYLGPLMEVIEHRTEDVDDLEMHLIAAEEVIHSTRR